MIYDSAFATVPETLERHTTDFGCAFVRQVAAAEINNIAGTDDDPVVPVADAGFDTAYFQPTLNSDMAPECEHCSKVPPSLSGAAITNADPSTAALAGAGRSSLAAQARFQCDL
jgi:hypothetical protein